MPILSSRAVVAGVEVTVQMYVHPHLYSDPDARESIERDLKARLVMAVIEKLDIRVRVEFDQRDEPGGFTASTTG